MTATSSTTEPFSTERLRQLEAFLPSFLIRQRWFGGKSRPIVDARFSSVTPVSASSAITTVAVHFADGETDLYQLPLTLATQPPGTPNAILATLDADGQNACFYDATIDPTFHHALLGIITGDHRSADLLAHSAATLDVAALKTVASRVGAAEQSNTSIIFGDLAILKLFRRLTSGENPDVEVGRFLAAAGFTGMPAYLGDITAADGRTLAYLQAFAPNQGDGWAWFLAELGSLFATLSKASPADDTQLQTLSSTTIQAAALLGRRTAEMHLALATPTADTAFSAAPYTTATVATEIDRITEQATSAFALLEDALQRLDPPIADKARHLLAARDRILLHIAGLTGQPSGFGQRIRIHGDYHLGQLLRTSSDFLIVDFEGEPAKSLAARRTRQTPLKDIAGMLRSFNYVAQSARSQQVASASLSTAAAAWEQLASDAFLSTYRTTLAANPALLPQSAQADHLLLALLFEKALYELVYELNNRPAWLYLPLEGLLSLVDRLPSGH